MQTEYKLTHSYSKGEYNKVDKEVQWIRLSEGCPNKCVYCAESHENGTDPIYFDIPELVRNKINILDMNLIYKPKALEIIKELGLRRVNGKVIYYTLQCGIDWRYMTQKLASALKQARFKEIRFAWDYGYNQSYKIKECLNYLIYAGYNPKQIQIFMICNWKTSYEDCCRKLNSCKFWNVQVSDCWFDNQLPPNIEPRHWTIEQIKDFRRRCRDHNIMCRHNGMQVEKLKT